MPRKLPSLNALRAFEAAARHQSFARAAEELHVTPAAISQQIKLLEDYLSLTLFQRGKTISLVEPAQAVLPLVTEAFDQLERAIQRLSVQPEDGPLIVSAPPTFSARWLISRIDDFYARYPDIELRILATRRKVDFSVEDVDVAVRFGPGPYPGLHIDRLMPEAIVPVVAPKLASRIHRVEDLLDCTLLHDESHDWDPTFPDWDTWLASQGVRPAKPLHVRRISDNNLVLQAVNAGMGAALTWYSLVADDLQEGRLVRLFDQMLPTSLGYQLLVPPNRLSLPKVAAFREWLLEQAHRQKGPHITDDAEQRP